MQLLMLFLRILAHRDPMYLDRHYSDHSGIRRLLARLGPFFRLHSHSDPLLSIQNDLDFGRACYIDMIDENIFFDQP